MVLLAAAGDARVLVELGGIILVLGIVARVAHSVRLSPVPFYLLVGLLVGVDGPITIGAGRGFIQTGATVGVVLLLFTLGLEYSADALVGNLRRNAPAGLVDLVANATPGFAVGLLLGWGVLAAVVLAGVTYISSSGIIAKVLTDLGRTANRETGVVLSVLVFEDLAMAIFLPVLGGLLAGGETVSMVLAVAAAVTVVIVVLVGALQFGGRLSRIVFAESSEVLLFTVLGITLVVAGIAESLEVSAAVGAFLVGIALSGPAAERAAPLISPLRDLFAGAFFVFFAMEIDLDTVGDVAAVAVVLAVLTAGTKAASGWWAANRAGIGQRGRWRAGFTLVARGEFSIVIAGLAVTAGVDPALGALAATYVLVLAFIGPLAARFSDPIGDWLSRRPAPTRA